MDGGPAGSGALEAVLDLAPYVNTSAPAVPEGFSLERAYRLFRQLGLRHLIVTDAHGHVKGIVTRKVGSVLTIVNRPPTPCSCSVGGLQPLFAYTLSMCSLWILVSVQHRMHAAGLWVLLLKGLHCHHA